MMRLRLVASALVFMTIMMHSVIGVAQVEKDDAISLARAAKVLADDGKFAQALELFEKAYSIDRAPILLGHMALLYEKTGKLDKAKEFYELFIENESDPARIAKAHERLDEIRQKMPGTLVVHVKPDGATVKVDQKIVKAGVPSKIPQGAHDVEVSLKGYATHTAGVDVDGDEETVWNVVLKPLPGQILVKGKPDGAKVSVDGRNAGTLPMRLPYSVAPGSHVVTVAAEGYEKFVRSVEVGPGASVSIVPEMEKIVVKVPVENPVVVPRPIEKPGPMMGGVVKTRKKGRSSPWPWVTIGTGAAALVTGGVMTGLAYGERSSVDDAQKSGNVIYGMNMITAADHVDRAETYDVVSYAMYGIGGAALVAGIVMAVVMPRDDDSVPQATPILGAAPLVGGAAVSAAWNF